MPETTQFAGMGGGDGFGDTSLKANTILQARYKILGVLGGGGMGTVYQARDLNFPDARRLVAVKEMLNPTNDPALHASTLSTFQREANILATLSHPAIPKIFDFFDQNDRVYLVMEYIHGSDLESLLNKTKELPMEKIVEWAIDLCDVLHYLHSQQPKPIIFRDMKPANIMVDSFGKIRLIDFGIAKIFDSGVKKHTMIGTEGYCAPEQYKGDVTPLSDIYSLGATLHHIMTRKDPRLEPPFSFNERPIKDYNPNTPDRLIAVIERALSFEPPNRFQSCAEMKAELEKLRQPLVMGSAGPARPAGEATDFFSDMPGTGEIQPKWKFATEDEIRCSPTAYRDIVYVGSYDTNIYAVELETGKGQWKYATHGGIASSPVVDEGNRLILFGSEDKEFYAIDFRGKQQWSYATKDRIRSSPYIAHDHVFFGSDDGFVYALAAPNGRFIWRYDMSAPVRARPFVTNDLVIVGCESGEVIALELSGNRKWGFRARKNVTSSPLVDVAEGMCYLGSSDNYMYALDASNGFQSWRYRTNGPIISSPVVEGDLLYFGSADGTLYAINAQTSKEKFKFTAEGPIVATPTVHNGVVYFGGTDGYFYCIDAISGKERWKFKANGPITAKAHIVGDVILFGSMDKTLYALPLVG
jgi:outer membrane protein assembly factor BamB/predicted Ser/Thr protein kinase